MSMVITKIAGFILEVCLTAVLYSPVLPGVQAGCDFFAYGVLAACMLYFRQCLRERKD